MEPRTESPSIRQLRPFLAFLAGFLGLGLGYVYVGKIRLAMATVAGVYGGLAFFCWTRLIVLSAAIYWFVGAVMVSISAISLIYPSVIARRNRISPRRDIPGGGFTLFGSVIDPARYAITKHRAGLLGYTTRALAVLQKRHRGGPRKVTSPITARTAGRCRRIIFCMRNQAMYFLAFRVRNRGRSSSRRWWDGFS
jgi:hypothetical protein